MTLALRNATHARHYCEQPQLTDADGAKHWITRAANFVTVVTDAPKGAVLARTGQADEYMAFVVSGSVVAEAGAERSESGADTLFILPPGDSRITLREAGRIVRVFSNKAADLLAAAGYDASDNASSSSMSVNTPSSSLSVRYRFPNTSPRM